MCIVFVANHVHPKYPLIIASNRDEFLDRPTEPMRVWSNNSHVECINHNNHYESNINSHDGRRGSRRLSLAGRDLVGGGTWLGIALPSDDDSPSDDAQEQEKQTTNNNTPQPSPTSLRWIAITNFRELEQHGRPSRGGLLMEYLEDADDDDKTRSACSFVHDLHPRGQEYNGFNLLVGDTSGIYYYGNRTKKDDDQSIEHPNPLGKGIFGLSNGLLDQWPKVQRGKELLHAICRKDAERQSTSPVESFHEELMSLLCDKTQPISDDQLPDTGIGPEYERYLSSIFIPKGRYFGKDYGTRTSTTIVVDTNGIVSILERTWWPEGGKDQWYQYDSNSGDKLEGMLLSRI